MKYSAQIITFAEFHHDFCQILRGARLAQLIREKLRRPTGGPVREQPLVSYRK